eukprot:2850210-Rhodomonas_salina.4
MCLKLPPPLGPLRPSSSSSESSVSPSRPLPQGLPAPPSSSLRRRLARNLLPSWIGFGVDRDFKFKLPELGFNVTVSSSIQTPRPS